MVEGDSGDACLADWLDHLSDVDVLPPKPQAAVCRVPVETVRELERELRFKVGDGVLVFQGEWCAGIVEALNYREPSWEDGNVAAYSIELDDDDQRGKLISIFNDSDEIVRARGSESWHKKAQRNMREASIASIYPPKALHPELFDPQQVDEWFVPALRSALERWQHTGDACDINLASIPALRLEAPGVVSFDCLTPGICEKLLAESKHYGDCGMPKRAPSLSLKRQLYGCLRKDNKALTFTFENFSQTL